MGWDRPKVIAELQRLHKRGADLSFTTNRGTALYAAAVRYCGGYRDAIELAGIEYQDVWRRRITKWDCERICQVLMKMHRARRNLSSRSLRRTDASLHAAAIHWFGSHRKAIEAAKIDFSLVTRRSKNVWTREGAIKELRRLHKNGQPMHHAAIERTHSHLVTVAYRFFGTYAKAVEAAGIDYLSVRIRPDRTWNRARVQRELKRMHRDRMGLWQRQVRRTIPYLPVAARQLFGSYPLATRAAGIKASALRPPEYRYWSHDRVVAALKLLHQQAHPMHSTQLLASKPYLFRVAGRRFGSYRKALKAAGLEYPPRPLRHWSESLVLKTLQELHDADVDLRFAAIKKHRLPLYEAARYYFGSYTNAVRVAGINYDAVVRKNPAAVERGLERFSSLIV